MIPVQTLLNETRIGKNRVDQTRRTSRICAYVCIIFPGIKPPAIARKVSQWDPRDLRWRWSFGQGVFGGHPGVRGPRRCGYPGRFTGGFFWPTICVIMWKKRNGIMNVGREVLRQFDLCVFSGPLFWFMFMEKLLNSRIISWSVLVSMLSRVYRY
jgi:hypothetical protein